MQRQNFNSKRTRSRMLVVPILGVLTGATAVLASLTRRWCTLPWSSSDPCRKFTWKTLRHRHNLTKGKKQLSDVLDSFHWNDEYTVYEALSHIISWIYSLPPLNLGCLSYSSQFFLLFFPFSEGWSGLTQTYNRNRSWTPFDPNTRAPFALLHSFPNISFHQIILKGQSHREGGRAETEGWNFLSCLRCSLTPNPWGFWSGPKAGGETGKLGCDAGQSSWQPGQLHREQLPQGGMVGPVSPAPMTIGYGLPQEGHAYGWGSSAAVADTAGSQLKAVCQQHSQCCRKESGAPEDSHVLGLSWVPGTAVKCGFLAFCRKESKSEP